MLNFIYPVKDDMKEVDEQLWHACAGGMVQMPAVGSNVLYFPQGHAEHAAGAVDFACRLPAAVPCTLAGVRFMADPDTDEVFAKLRLVPAAIPHADAGDATTDTAGNPHPQPPPLPSSFAKTLTQSDANNGGGFSVPRYCAETIFPPLNYTTEPPVQTLLARDVHGQLWKFRHIYRGTPRRHLLTTGWSIFVNQKKLVAGDSIVFLKTADKDLCVGIRRAKRGADSQSGWNPYNRLSMLWREEGGDGKVVRGASHGYGRARVRPECVVEAARLAAAGKPFEVVYYPRASTPEFVVKASAMGVVTRVQWRPGMRFKMAFETEDSSRISWFMGTISSVQPADPVRWPTSPWRALQVTWDEPDLLQNVKCVSPWLVELVSNMPAIHLTPFSPPRKKLRLPVPHLDFPMDGEISVPKFTGNPQLFGFSNSLCGLNPENNPPAGIQGARHTQFGLSLSDLHLNKLQSGMFPGSFRSVDLHHSASPSRVPFRGHMNSVAENVSCLLTIGNSGHSPKKAEVKTAQFILFGQPIHTEEQLSGSNSGSSSSDGSADKSPNSSSNGFLDNTSSKVFPFRKDHKHSDLGLETGHCKVFMESEDVGRTLDLSVLGSYEELFRKLSHMFGIERSETLGNVLYRDAKGTVKHIGDDPFSEFTETARRLTILLNSGIDNMAR